MKTKPHIFKTFPEFSKLTLSDMDKYESLVEKFPSYAEFSFPFLMTWWSGLGNCRVAQLNGNLVIAYWFPGYDEYSGLSVVGTNEVDETFAFIADYLKQRNEPARLVHVPEFVASSMRYPELYSFEDERSYDECMLSVSDLENVGDMIRHKRCKVRRFMAEVDESRVEIKQLDLADEYNQRLLLDAAADWQPRGGINDICRREQEALRIAITQAENLNLQNLCIYIDGELHHFLLYQLSADSSYAINYYSRISYAMPHIFEFVAYKTGQWFAKQGVQYFNIKYDLGKSGLRSHKLSLRPADFFRKYTITPV